MKSLFAPILRGSLIAFACLFLLLDSGECGYYKYHGSNYNIPSGVTAYNGDSYRYEGHYTLQNAGSIEFRPGSTGMLVAGDRITLRPSSTNYYGSSPQFHGRKVGFVALEGSNVRIMIDSNFNGISDFVEAIDSDGDGLFDALEDVLGTSNAIGAHGYEVDFDGDGIFDKIVNVVPSRTTSQYIPDGSFQGYLNRSGYSGNAESYYEAYGTYYSQTVGLYNPTPVSVYFGSFNEWLDFNFSITYTQFNFETWTQHVMFRAASGVEYNVQGYYPGVGWFDIDTVIGSGGYELVILGPDSEDIFYFLSDLPYFIRIVELGKATIDSSSSDIDSDKVILESVGTLDGNSLLIDIPEVLSIPSSSNIDWIDKRVYGNTTPWEIDLNGDGLPDATLDPKNQSGKVSVPILGKTVDIEVDSGGGVFVGVGKYKIGQTATGALAVTIPDALTGTDGTVRLTFEPSPVLEFVPDLNRDGKITASDRGLTSANSPYYFWINDDDDSGDTGGTDIPGSENMNGTDSLVNGRRDLIDFFPLYLDLNEVIDDFPFNEYKYLLMNKDGALNFLESKDVYLDRNPHNQDAPGSHLRNVDFSGKMQSQSIKRITASGTEISDVFLNTVERYRRGVVYVEGRAETLSPLSLKVVNKSSNDVALQYDFPISISPVESMYRHVNIHNAVLKSEGVPTDQSEPKGWPDAGKNDTYFIYVHGYNVNAEQSRGANSEMFKRLYWSGMNSRYVAVYWYGWESQKYILGQYKCPDFYENTINAFRSSNSLRESFAHIDNSRKVVAAHSLGNMLVSSAIDDQDNFNPAKFFMLNAAVPTEAYDNSLFGSELLNMTNNSWSHLIGINRVRASHWHTLFSPDDARRQLTWKGRFSSVTQAYNFYSSGENVLDNGDGNPPPSIFDGLWEGTLSWYAQEWSKGTLNALLTAGPGDDHGGWGFNTGTFGYYYGASLQNPDYVSSIPISQFQIQPIFKRFSPSDSDLPTYDGTIFSPDGDPGTQSKINFLTKNKLLAEAIPSTSFAAGRNPIQKFEIYGERNFDMQNEFQSGWPSSRAGDFRWKHGDLKTIAYIYIYQLFDTMVLEGGLDL